MLWSAETGLLALGTLQHGMCLQKSKFNVNGIVPENTKAKTESPPNQHDIRTH